MDIFGIDFTSRPSRRKPLTLARCILRGERLDFVAMDALPTFAEFERLLRVPGPWIAALDFPFGHARRFVEGIGWPLDWASYVATAHRLGRDGYRQALEAYKADRPLGDKEHRRAADKVAASISPQKLYGVPVALMFFEGAPRLVASGVTVPGLQAGDPQRIVVEGYPGIVARRLIGRRSYKNDDRARQTPALLESRHALLAALRAQSVARYGIAVEAPDAIADDPSGDQLDAFICAVQAAWAWRRRERGFGMPADADRLEGWIADPHVSAQAPG